MRIFKVRAFTFPVIPALMIAGLMAVTSCSRSQDQVEFEQRAFQIPENFTKTDHRGEIIREDKNDWNIAPMFQGTVEVFIPAFPNPTSNEPVQIELMLSGSRTVHGLRAEAFYDMFNNLNRRTLYEHDRSPLEPGLLVFTIDPADFDINRSYSSARQVNDGLHRLFIFDGNNNLITFGDIKLE